MSFRVIDNPSYDKFRQNAGFRNCEFKMLAGLFSQGASVKALYDMSVDVDFEAGTCAVSYFISAGHAPFLQFIIRQVGPKTAMYELWKEGKGRVFKSGLFARTFDVLRADVDLLIAAKNA